MKKIIFLAALLIVLAGAGAGAYFYFMQPAEAASQESGEHGKAEETASHGGDGHGGGSGVEFVELDPLILPILSEDGVSQTVSIVVAIEVTDASGIEIVEKMTPRLKDAYIQELYGVLSFSASRHNGVIHIGMLKSRLTKITKKVMGDEVIHDVLLQVVQQRGV